MLETPMLRVVKQKTKGYPCSITNIETGRVSVGVPDWFLRTDFSDIWIEAKEIKRWPIRDNTSIKIKYRPGQYSWLISHQKLGGKALLMCTYKDKWFLFKDIRKEYSKYEMNNLNLLSTTDFNFITGYRFMNILNNI